MSTSPNSPKSTSPLAPSSTTVFHDFAIPRDVTHPTLNSSMDDVSEDGSESGNTFAQPNVVRTSSHSRRDREAHSEVSVSRGSRTPDSSHSSRTSKTSGRSSSRPNFGNSRNKPNKLALLVKEGKSNILYPKTIQRIYKAIGGISIAKLHEQLLSNKLFSPSLAEIASDAKELAFGGKTEGETEGETKEKKELSFAAAAAAPPAAPAALPAPPPSSSSYKKESYGVPCTLDKHMFDLMFRECLMLTTSRHGRWILDNSHNIGRLFYAFDLQNRGEVCGPECLCTIAALSSGSLEEKLAFCFDVVADSISHKTINAQQTVMLFRGFTNQGSNWTISEALGQVEQFGTDVVEDARSGGPGGRSQGLRMQSSSSKGSVGSKLNLLSQTSVASSSSSLAFGASSLSVSALPNSSALPSSSSLLRKRLSILSCSSSCSWLCPRESEIPSSWKLAEMASGPGAMVTSFGSG